MTFNVNFTQNLSALFAICNLSVVPVRKEPSDKSEMVTQLLLGETVEIISKDGNWRKIRATFDDYNGWVDKKQLLPIGDSEYALIETQPVHISTDLVQIAVKGKNEMLPLMIGSVLRHFSGKAFRIGDAEFEFEGNVQLTDKPRPENVLLFSYMFLNAPYLWGGRTPFGIDCSGFTQLVFKLSGYKLKRDAYQQAEQGELVHLLEEAKPGDLAFFDNAEKKIIHVGIILSGHKVIHASGKVRIDRLDHQGIFNSETGQYSHNLRLIKRIM